MNENDKNLVITPFILVFVYFYTGTNIGKVVNVGTSFPTITYIFIVAFVYSPYCDLPVDLVTIVLNPPVSQLLSISYALLTLLSAIYGMIVLKI